MRVKNKKKRHISQKNTLRTHRHMFVLNDKEEDAFNKYIEKYKIENKSRFIREVLMCEVIRRMENDAPTLFDNLDKM